MQGLNVPVKYTTLELYSLAHILLFTGEQISISPGTSEEAMPSACCQRFIWDVIQQLIQSCSLLDCVVSHENVLPDVITLFSREQSIVFLLVVWCILWLPLRTCCYPVFVHDLWLKVKWKKQLFSEAFRATTKTNIFEALSKFFWTNEGGKINKNVHLIVFQQHGIHSKEFGRTNKISYLLLSIRNPAQKSVRTTRSFLKVLSWEVLKAVLLRGCEC